jgi:hypothetical protein
MLKQSAVSGQHSGSAVSNQQSAVSGQHSAVSKFRLWRYMLKGLTSISTKASISTENFYQH